MNFKILILDDEQRIVNELSEFLRKKGFAVKSAETPSMAFSLLNQEQFDIMILDVRLPQMSGIEVLKKVKQDYPDLEVILISGHGNMDTVIEALRSGACDFLPKPFRQSDLQLAIERTTRFIKMQKNMNQLRDDNSLISRELESLVEKNFIGGSPQIQKMLTDAIHLASFADTPIVISGESGTGKEIIARIIHYASPRKKYKFCPINCAAIPENLMESEFFGHKRGAFTGAVQDTKGILELGRGGSIFLDEIGDMPLYMQTKLLRVIEEKKYMKLGSSTEVSVDVRFMAATNKDLETQIRDNTFRTDLYYRLAAYRIHIPPLRERQEDIEPLINYFCQSFCEQNRITIPSIDPQIIKEIVHYKFPGNVRELKNLVERALIINRDAVLSFDDFPFLNGEEHFSTSALDQAQIYQIKKALEEAGSNQSQAARALGISRYSLIRKMRKFGIE